MKEFRKRVNYLRNMRRHFGTLAFLPEALYLVEISAFYKNLVSAIRPAIASIKDANERKAVVDALTKT